MSDPTSGFSESLSSRPAPLHGWQVVVTRPQPAADQTAKVLRSAGAQVLVAPMLDIGAVPLPPVQATALASQLADSGFATSIFVSTHAVEHGLRALGGVGHTALGAVFAIGAATARRLADKGFPDARAPETGEDSEALLADVRFTEVTGRRILLVRGQSEAGGRQLLADSLRARGAALTELICYERRPAELAADAIDRLREAVAQGAAVLFGSVETLESFARVVPISSIRVALVPHPRIAAVAQQLGAAETRVVSLADNKLVASMLVPVA
jgi:uroporphyrinogen-III synthase